MIEQILKQHISSDENLITLSPISSSTTMHIDEGLHGQLDVNVITLFMSNFPRIPSSLIMITGIIRKFVQRGC